MHSFFNLQYADVLQPSVRGRETDLLDQRLISQVAVKEVEVRSLLQKDHFWTTFLEGAFQEMQGVVFAIQTGIVQREKKGRDVFLASFVLVAPEQPLRYCAVTSLIKGTADGLGGVLIILGEKSKFEVLSRFFIHAFETVGI